MESLLWGDKHLQYTLPQNEKFIQEIFLIPNFCFSDELVLNNKSICSSVCVLMCIALCMLYVKLLCSV
jgi:hypothetical protein